MLHKNYKNKIINYVLAVPVKLCKCTRQQNRHFVATIGMSFWQFTQQITEHYCPDHLIITNTITLLHYSLPSNQLLFTNLMHGCWCLQFSTNCLFTPLHLSVLIFAISHQRLCANDFHGFSYTRGDENDYLNLSISTFTFNQVYLIKSTIE